MHNGQVRGSGQTVQVRRKPGISIASTGNNSNVCLYRKSTRWQLIRGQCTNFKQCCSSHGQCSAVSCITHASHTTSMRRQAWRGCGIKRPQTALLAHASATAEPHRRVQWHRGGPGWGYGAKWLSKVWPAEGCSGAKARLAYFRSMFGICVDLNLRSIVSRSSSEGGSRGFCSQIRVGTTPGAHMHIISRARPSPSPSPYTDTAPAPAPSPYGFLFGGVCWT